MAARKAPRGKPKTEMVAPQIGSVGLKHTGGMIREEFVRELQGWRGIKVFREMGDNSAEVGSSLSVISLVATRAKWVMEPYAEPGKPPEQEDIRRAEWFESCFNDMDRPWTSVVRSAMTMLQYGFAPHEIVLKVRDGVGSKYSDGLIGWKKLAFRPQDSLDPARPWDLTPNGECLGLYQRNPTTQQVVRIPRAKFLNFRPSAGKDNPEGVSVLRHVYFTYFFAKRMRETEGIGVERSFNGLPVMSIPAECMAPGASADLAAVYTGAKEIVENIRNDQDAGVVIGQDYKDGQPLYKFELLSASGSSLPDTSKIIDRYDKRIQQSFSTDFMMLGHEGVGSYALGDSKLAMFELAVEGYLDFIQEPIQGELIPLTMMLNGWPLDRCPKLKHLPLETTDLARWGDFVNKMVSANVITPDEGLESAARRVADLPPRDEANDEERVKRLPVKDRVETLGALVRAGYVEKDATDLTGLPPLKRMPLIPVTLLAPKGESDQGGGGSDPEQIPDSNTPDKGKPPETNPGKSPEKNEYASEERIEAMATDRQLLQTVGILGAALADRAAPTVEVTVQPTPVQIVNEVRSPDVFVEAPVVHTKVEVSPTPVTVQVPTQAAPIVRVEAKAAPSEGVQSIAIVSLPPPPESITTVEERDKEGRVKRTRKRAVKG